MVALVSCGRKKADKACAAHRLYTSTLFQYQYRYAKYHTDTVYILSALHGIVHPNKRLEPYNVCLSDLDKPKRRLWSLGVAAQLVGLGIATEPLLLLTGQEYLGFLSYIKPTRVINPYSSLTCSKFGYRIQFLKRFFDAHKIDA